MNIKKCVCTATTILLCLTLFYPTVFAAPNSTQEEKLIFGIIPSRSTITMFNRFAPLRDYLSTQLKHTVILETAPNYDIFLQRSRQQKYDFILTAPHFALLTLDSGHYEVSATYRVPLAAAILVHKDSKYQKLSDIAGKPIATPPQQAIITMAGKYYLMKSGLTGSRKPTYILTKTHSASLHLMLSGETDATIVSTNVARHAFKQGQPIRTLSQSPEIPSMALLANINLPPELRDKFGKLLINMHKNTEGRHILKEINYPGYRKATKQEFEPVRPYLNKYWK